MNNKAKRNVIVSAVMAIAVCVSLVAGATYALFTSESPVNVAVTSGKVEVVATISDFSVYSPASISQEDGNAILDATNAADTANYVFANLGTAELNGNEITLTNVTAGDKVTFKITVTNKSNVKTQYRTVVKKVDDDGLFDALNFNVGGITVENSTVWQMLDPATGENGDTVASYDCFVELPATANNDYQGKKCTIAFNVEAVQGNAKTTNVIKQVSAEDNLGDVIANAFAENTDAESVSLILPESEEETSFDIKSGAVSVPAGKTRTISISGNKNNVVSLNGASTGSEGNLSYQDNVNITISGVTYDASKADGICARGGVVKFVGCTIKGELKKTIASKFVFTDCEFENGTSAKECISHLGYGCHDIVIENCTFTASNGRSAIKIYSEGNTPINLTVRNCTFENTSESCDKPAILLDHIIDNLTYSVSIENCTFKGFITAPAPTNSGRTIIAAGVITAETDGVANYVFAYQTGVESGNYYKLLDVAHLSVKIDGVEKFVG